MTTIGGTAPRLTGAAKHPVEGEMLAQEARLPIDELKWHCPMLSEAPPGFVETFIGLAELFGIDTTDTPTLISSFGRYLSTERAEFQNELDSRDAYGFTPLHRAVMQGKRKLVEYVCQKYTADPSELVTGVAYREVAARSIGVRNKQMILDNNPHAGRNALTLAVTCNADINIIHFLADCTVNGQKLVGLRDGNGDTALCLAIENNRLDCVLHFVAMHHRAIWLANGKGVKPLELAIKKGQVESLGLIISDYLPALCGYSPDLQHVALADLRNAASIVATCWTELPNREAILACLLKSRSAGFRREDGTFVTISACAVRHCMSVLFIEAVILFGSEPDSYDLLTCCTPDDLGKRDYSLMQALLNHGGHQILADGGKRVLLWALDHKNDILADLCRKAGIRLASSESVSVYNSDA